MFPPARARSRPASATCRLLGSSGARIQVMQHQRNIWTRHREVKLAFGQLTRDHIERRGVENSGARRVERCGGVRATGGRGHERSSSIFRRNLFWCAPKFPRYKHATTLISPRSIAEMSADTVGLPGGRNPLLSTSKGVAVPADRRGLGPGRITHRPRLRPGKSVTRSSGTTVC